MHVDREKLLKRFYAFLFVMPIFGLNGIPGTKISFWMIFILSMLLLFFVTRFKRPVIRCDMAYVPFAVYILLQTVMAVAVLDHPDVPGLVLAVGQYLCYYIILILINPNWFDKKTGTKYLLVAADIATIYILIQEVLAIAFGIYLPQGMPFLPKIGKGVISYTKGISEYERYRPRSFFSEPAEYVIFAAAALVVNAVMVTARDRKEKRIKTLRTALYIVGIVVSRSTSGFMTLVLLALYYLYDNYLKGRKGITSKVLIAVPVLVVGIAVASQTFFLQFQFDRLNQGSLAAFIAREPRLKILLHLEALDMTSWYKILFGHDFNLDLLQTEDVFFNSFLRQLYCFGIIGEILMLVLLVKLWKRADRPARYMIFTFITIMLAGGTFHNGAILVYFTWTLPAAGMRERPCAVYGDRGAPVLPHRAPQNSRET